MKKTLIILVTCFLCFFANAGFGKSVKYFILNTSSTEYQLRTVKLAHQDKTIELYNLFVGNSNLILFSVLPMNNEALWKPIDVNTIKNLSLDFVELKDLLSHGFARYNQSNFYDSSPIKRQDVILVVNRGGKYYASNFCLLEYFCIISQKLVFPNLMGNAFININSPSLSTKEFETKYLEAHGSYSPNSISERYASGTTALRRPLEKPLLFYSGETDVFGYKAYRFWQFADWHINHGINTYRGIDRFLFVPKIGIVAGSFDAFFQNKQRKQLQQEYLEERMFLPKNKADIILQN